MPFPYYNTGLPTASDKNTINKISVDYGIRDFLLNKNISPRYPFISTSLNGSPKIGEPVLDTSTNVDAILASIPIEVDGVLRMSNATLMNRYKNDESNAEDLQSIDTLPYDTGLFPNSTIPNGIGKYPTTADDTVYSYGIMGKTEEKEYRKKVTLKNLYVDASRQVDMADFVSLFPVQTSQQVTGGYLDIYGGLNLGGSAAIEASSIIGSVLNGQGLGLAKGGVVTNFDLRASLAGRVLGTTGLINDTKLGMIGSQQLALSLANNAAFNLEQSALGSLNVQDNILSLIKGGSLAGFRPNYTITVSSTGGGKAFDYTAKILGFTVPKSFLEDAGSIFLSESDSANIERANSMILNTGKGQVAALIENMNANLIGTTAFDSPENTYFRSGYVPGYKDNKGRKAINPNTYAFGDADGLIYNFVTSGQKSPIPDISVKHGEMIEEYGFTDMPITSPNDFGPFPTRATWNTNEGGLVNSEYTEGTSLSTQDPKTKKTLLAKTQILFNSANMKNIIASKGDMSIHTPSQIQTAVVGGGISHGNAVKSKEALTASLKTAEATYCRSWTSHRRYAQVQDLVRSRGLDTGNPYRNNTQGSVLDDNGFVKIAPYTTDSPSDPKKFMFSIENLAWSDNEGLLKLLPSEVGPGDLISGKKGRIMWFPPYNIQFSENNTVNWESTNFIGRGEPVYTYSNSERSGTLSFQIVVDHPSYMNAFRGTNGPEDDYIDSYFAGCVDLEKSWADKLTTDEQTSIQANNLTVPQKKNIEAQVAPPDFNIYFPNDVNAVPSVYENGLSGATTADTIDYATNVNGFGFGLGAYPADATLGVTATWNDRYNYGLNGYSYDGKTLTLDNVQYRGFLDQNFQVALLAYIQEKCPACRAEVTGYASSQGNAAVNQTLADTRAANVVEWLKTNVYTGFANKDKYVKAMPSSELPNTGVNGGDTDALIPKQARKVTVHFVFDPTLVKNVEPDPVVQNPASSTQRVTTTIKNRFYDESIYFDKLKQEDYFIFDKIREKIKYFHPAFHSTTPEGLNSRLTFLLQCTRQGPTIGGGANNLSFGRPPVCILRIGDFYNTKIIIDNIGIDYEPLVWDLNPEGVGVQPMIANVNMSFKIIGGSSLMSPINKLQNALSFNYFANTHVYDTRADYIARDPNRDVSAKISALGNDGSEIFGTKLNYGADLIDGYKGPMDAQVTTTKSDVIDNTPVINQTEASDVATGPTSPETSPDSTVSEPKITALNPVTVTSNSTYWLLNVKCLTENVNTPADEDTLFNQHISFSLTNTLGDKFEQIKLTRSQYNEIVLSTGGELSFLSSKFPTGLYNLKLEVGGVKNKMVNINLI